MRIGIDCRIYSGSSTGIGRSVYELISYLSEKDEENEYVLFFNDPEYEGFTLPNERWSKVLVNAKRYSLKEQIVFLSKLYRAKLDIMHFTHFNAPIFYFRPSVVTIRDLTLSFYPGRRMKQPYQRIAYNLMLKNVVRKAEKVIAVSHHTKRDIIETLDVPDDKITVIYEGVDRTDYAHADEEQIQKMRSYLDIRKEYLFYVGVVREHKNLLRLIKAYKQLLDEGMDGIDLVIAGREDTSLEIRNFIIKEKLQKQVKLLGYVADEDLNLLYSGARALVYPSLYEGFGLPILEAFAHSLPIACSNLSCLPEIAGKDGASFFNPLSIQGMTEAIKKVLYDEPFRKNLISNGLKRLEDFGWEKMGEQTLKLYNGMKPKEVK